MDTRERCAFPLRVEVGVARCERSNVALLRGDPGGGTEARRRRAMERVGSAAYCDFWNGVSAVFLSLHTIPYQNQLTGC